MPYITQTRDLTLQYLGYDRDIDSFRSATNQTFTPGSLVQMAPRGTGTTVANVEVYPDYATVQLPAITANNSYTLMGVVADTWPGFGGSVSPGVYLSSTNVPGVLTRGTHGVDIVLRGYHPSILLDQSGTAAVTLVNGCGIVASRATAGYGQGLGIATAAETMGVAAIAALPATGFGSSLTAAALAQATAVFTIAGTPTLGDVYIFTNTAPWTTAAPGVAQTISWTTPPLTAGQAATATTAALAALTYLNAQPSFSQYYTATQVAGVITWTVNTLANTFQVTAGSGTTITDQYNLSVSGMIVNNATNGFTISAAVGAGTVSTLTATTQWAGGTGYKGVVPGYVVPS
jgi:hypothetical protein